MQTPDYFLPLRCTEQQYQWPAVKAITVASKSSSKACYETPLATSSFFQSRDSFDQLGRGGWRESCLYILQKLWQSWVSLWRWCLFWHGLNSNAWLACSVCLECDLAQGGLAVVYGVWPMASPSCIVGHVGCSLTLSFQVLAGGISGSENVTFKLP